MKNFFKKFCSYSFWVSLSGAVVILLNAFGRAFGFKIENQVVEDCIMAVAGVLVVFGICFKSTKENPETDKNEEEKVDEENSEKDEDNNENKE